MKVIVLIRHVFKGLTDLQHMSVFNEQKILEITVAELDNLRIGKDESREANGNFRAGNVVLLERKEQEIGEIGFCVELEVVVKEQIAVIYNDQVEITVVDVDENHFAFGRVFETALEENTVAMGDFGLFPFS